MQSLLLWDRDGCHSSIHCTVICQAKALLEITNAHGGLGLRKVRMLRLFELVCVKQVLGCDPNRNS